MNTSVFRLFTYFTYLILLMDYGQFEPEPRHRIFAEPRVPEHVYKQGYIGGRVGDGLVGGLGDRQGSV